jgi:hypothetical protein
LKAREIEYIPLVKLTLMALEIDRRDLTNRVNRDEGCAVSGGMGAAARPDGRAVAAVWPALAAPGGGSAVVDRRLVERGGVMGEGKQACETIGIEYQTARNCGAVAEKFHLSRRRDKLPFTHHAELCTIDDPDVQDRFLDWCEETLEAEGKPRSTRELRRHHGA